MNYQQSYTTMERLGESEASMLTVLEESTTSMTSDDYGEFDFSLRSYLSSTPGVDKTFGFTHVEAIDLLNERVGGLRGLLGELEVNFDKSGKCWFGSTAGDDFTVDISIADDTKAVVVSTVVHRVRSAPATDSQTIGAFSNQAAGQSYSLMTKMMKHNALLKANPSDAGICGHIYRSKEGHFVFVCSMSLRVLFRDGKLKKGLHDFILTAMSIKWDFKKVSGKRLGMRRKGS